MTYYNQDNNSESLRPYFIGRNERSAKVGMAIDTFMNIPGLVGFWPMSSVQRSTGNAYDLSSQNRTLSYNGNPIYNIYNDIMPYIDLDGTNDYLSRPSETDLDITGTETIYDSSVRGLTIGGCYWFDAIGTNNGLHTKFDGTISGSSWSMSLNSFGLTNSCTFNVFSSPNQHPISSGNNTIITNTWYFIVGRYIPSTEVKLFINDDSYSTTSNIPPSINITSSNLELGSDGGISSRLNGRLSFNFLSSNSLSDAYINILYQNIKSLL